MHTNKQHGNQSFQVPETPITNELPKEILDIKFQCMDTEKYVYGGRYFDLRKCLRDKKNAKIFAENINKGLLILRYMSESGFFKSNQD